MTAKSERKLRTQAGKKPVNRNCLRLMLTKKEPKKRRRDMRNTSVPCSQPGPSSTPSAFRQSTAPRSRGSVAYANSYLESYSHNIFIISTFYRQSQAKALFRTTKAMRIQKSTQ